MHRLDRPHGSASECLSDFDYRTNTWDDVKSECKAQIRDSLVAIQGHRCAYCESSIKFASNHIEHFRRKGGPPPQPNRHLTFDWDNLFLACQSLTHCGHYKDRRDAPAYDPDDLIKPDVEDPHTLLYFYKNGAIRPRKALSNDEMLRANATVRVFGLDNQQLAAQRRKAAERYAQNGDLSVVQTWSPEDRRDWVNLEIEAIKDAPYFSTILHLLERTS